MARFRLTSPRIKLTENDVEKACLDVLHYHGYWVIRQHAGRLIAPDEAVVRALRAAGAPFRWITVGEAGVPDWAAVHPERPGFLMEVKRPGGKLSPEQQVKIQELELWPLEIAVIDSPEAIFAWLKEHRK